MAQTNGPDWPVIGGFVVTALGLIGGAIAWTSGVFRQHGSAEQKRQETRDKDATANVALTLDSVFRLVNELQEEVGRRGDALIASEDRCASLVQVLDGRVAELKAEVLTLNRKVTDLEHELRDQNKGAT